jgi:hypothetical protein
VRWRWILTSRTEGRIRSDRRQILLLTLRGLRLELSIRSSLHIERDQEGVEFEASFGLKLLVIWSLEIIFLTGGRRMGSIRTILKHPEDVPALVRMKIAQTHALKQIPSEPDLAFCFTMLQRVSRSFAFVIQQLGPDLRNAVRFFISLFCHSGVSKSGFDVKVKSCITARKCSQ